MTKHPTTKQQIKKIQTKQQKQKNRAMWLGFRECPRPCVRNTWMIKEGQSPLAALEMATTLLSFMKTRETIPANDLHAGTLENVAKKLDKSAPHWTAAETAALAALLLTKARDDDAKTVQKIREHIAAWNSHPPTDGDDRAEKYPEISRAHDVALAWRRITEARKNAPTTIHTAKKIRACNAFWDKDACECCPERIERTGIAEEWLCNGEKTTEEATKAAEELRHDLDACKWFACQHDEDTPRWPRSTVRRELRRVCDERRIGAMLTDADIVAWNEETDKAEAADADE